MIRKALTSAWRAWSGNFLLLSAVVAVTYWPLDMLQSYIEYHWMDPDDFRKSLNLTRFIDQFFLIIPDAAVYYIGLLWFADKRCSFGEALGAGLRNYGRLWVTRFLVYLSYLTLLLLVLPGVYLITRWSMSEVCTVAQGRLGTAAFRCSWASTQARFWQVLGALSIGGLMLVCLIALPVVLSLALPDLWWIDALTSMAMSIFLPFGLLYDVGVYAQLSEESESVAA